MVMQTTINALVKGLAPPLLLLSLFLWACIVFILVERHNAAISKNLKKSPKPHQTDDDITRQKVYQSSAQPVHNIAFSSNRDQHAPEDEAKVRNKINTWKSLLGVGDEAQLYEYSDIYSPYQYRLTDQEKNIISMLIASKMFSPYCVFMDSYFKSDGDRFSQIDVIAVSKHGVFVIEAKDYNCWITGDSDHKYWRASYYGGQKESLYNPIYQNRRHASLISKLISDQRVPVYSMIVFGDGATLKDVHGVPRHTYVVQNSTIIDALRDLANSPATLSEESVKNICKIIYHSRIIPDNAMRESHIKRIKDDTGEGRIYRNS